MQNLVLTKKHKVYYVKKNPKNLLKRNYIFSIVACALMILWGPITFWIIGIDGAGRTPRILLLFAFINSFHSIQKYSFKRPLLIYFLLGLYMFLNGLIKGGQDSYPKDGIYLLFCDATTAPFMLFLLVNLFRKHFDKTLSIFIGVLYLYTILFAIFATFEEKGGFIRLNGEINANEAALLIAICFLLILLSFIKGNLKLYQVILLSIIPIGVIMQTGSRMAVLMCVIGALSTIIINSKHKKHKIKTLLGTGILAIGIIFILNHTMVGKRMSYTTEQAEEATWATGTAWDLFGDRGIAYYNSWPYFIKNPITGIGFQKWVQLNTLELRAHSEYLVMYLENGIIGLLLYLYIIILFFKNLHQYRKQRNISYVELNTSKYLTLCLILILIANTMLWSFNEYCVFIVYAICYALCPNTNNLIKYNQKEHDNSKLYIKVKTL